MYSQYQQYQQQHHGGAVQQPGLTWNGNSWVPAAAQMTAAATTMASGNGYYSQYSQQQQQQPFQQHQQQSQNPQIPPNPVQTYTKYYHEWTALWNEQVRLQQDHNQPPNIREQAQQQAAWYKYYADQSSRAAHHFHGNPAAQAAPFDLPPAPSTANASVGVATAGQNQQQQQQQQFQPRSVPVAPPAPPAPKASKASAPDSLQRFVDRCLRQCTSPTEKTAVMQQVHQTMAAAIKEGRLHSTNWDQAALIPVPGKQPSVMASPAASSMSSGPGGSNLVPTTASTMAASNYTSGGSIHYGPSSAVGGVGSNHYRPPLSSPSPTAAFLNNNSSGGGAGGGSYYGPSSSTTATAAVANSAVNFTSSSSYYGAAASGNSNTNVNNSKGSSSGKKKSKQNKKQSQTNNDGHYGPASSSSSLSSFPHTHHSLKHQQQQSVLNDFGSGGDDFIAFSSAHVNIVAGKKRKHNKVERKNSGLNESHATMTDRAKRFSGPGGLTDASAAPRPVNGFDKYMGKETIGGSKVMLTDEDYEQMTVKGTSNKLDKEYLRLTAPPRAELVRPKAVLVQHLQHLKAERQETSKRREYDWFCSQLKAVRQDCRVQRIVDAFTVDVYETHARIALEEGDLNEYNQCQTQLKELYVFLKDDATAVTNHNEFVAYRLLYYVFLGCNQKSNGGGSSDLFHLLLSLTPEQKQDAAIQHALKVRVSVADWDYHLFFGLIKGSPNLGVRLMDRIVPYMRHTALQIICKAYRPAVETAYCLQELGFEDNNYNLEFGRKWLVSCGCVLSEDGSQFITKDSVIHESHLEEKQSLI
jgi:hypothetical protein